MQKELSTRYEPKEDKWYQHQLQTKIFHSEIDYTKKPYTIVIPPPNSSGRLHIGHALNNTFQDILARTKRMQGYNVCWLPGIDSGGISTETVVEGQLIDQ